MCVCDAECGSGKENRAGRVPQKWNGRHLCIQGVYSDQGIAAVGKGLFGGPGGKGIWDCRLGRKTGYEGDPSEKDDGCKQPQIRTGQYADQTKGH